MKTTFSDTLYYVYTIKDDCVRIDEYDKYKRVIRAYIVNLQDKSVMLINPNKRIYTKVESFPVSEKYVQNLEVVNTGNHKYINGYYCSQWRVRNLEENMEITYWVAGENFNFYTPMSQVAMSLEDYFLFFKALPHGKMRGVMPMMIENKTLLRAPKSTLNVTQVKQHVVDTSVFNLSQYQKFENLR
ncbi:MAG: DUF4412 domain-containing protein [Bacteroidales bacterium]|nr:DUF4412 domain-containing protein [Bacteroidales bacterium]